MKTLYSNLTAKAFSWRKIIVYVFVLGGLLLFLYSRNSISVERTLSQEHLMEIIQSAGIFSWLVYLLLVTLSVLSPITSSVIVLVGGYLFHPLLAIGLNLIAEMLGASGNFFIGRKLARKFMIKKFPKMKRYADQLNTKIVFLLALIPVGTSNITGYIAGISKMRFKRYLGTWMLGITLLNTSIALLGYSARIQSVKLTVIIIVIGLISMYGIYQIIKKWE
ncbi:VTT domain-containing protein [Patescibacteria group bacterium]|nr:VTT domain-containing protein [Patescibacteria group bacterium]